MAALNVIVRTPDQTKKAEIGLQSENTGKDVIEAAIQNWALPRDTDYSLVNITQGKALQHGSTLKDAGVENGNILEVQPVLVAGN
jgi:hypothetical protein